MLGRSVQALAALLLAGCVGGYAPNNSDGWVDVIVSNQGPDPRWYNVTLLDGADVVLQRNVTAARPPHDIDANPRGKDAGYADVGRLRAGTYEVVVRSQGNPTATKVVEVDTRHIVYVHQDEGFVRISLSTLGE